MGEGEYWVTDPELFRALTGAQELVDWFGFVPSFHDAELEQLEIKGGDLTISLNAFRMTDKVDENGYFVLDKHALVSICMHGVLDLTLMGGATSTISSIEFRRVVSPTKLPFEGSSANVGDYQVKIETCAGMEGNVFARDVSFSFIATK